MKKSIVFGLFAFVIVGLVPFHTRAVEPFRTAFVIEKSPEQIEREQLQQQRQKRIEELKKCVSDDGAVRLEYIKRMQAEYDAFKQAVKNAESERLAARKFSQEKLNANLKAAREQYAREMQAAVDATARKNANLKYRSAYKLVVETRDAEFKAAWDKYQNDLAKIREQLKLRREESKDARGGALFNAHQPCVLGAQIESTQPQVLGWTWRPSPSRASASSLELGEADQLKAQELLEQRRQATTFRRETLRLQMEDLRARQAVLRECRLNAAQVYRSSVERAEQFAKDELALAESRMSVEIAAAGGSPTEAQAAKERFAEAKASNEAARVRSLQNARETRTQAFALCPTEVVKLP